MRRTIRTSAAFRGKGLHSGYPVKVTVHPGDEGLLIRSGNTAFRACWDNVSPSSLCTLLRSPDDPMAQLSTVEHLMAALYGLGVTDAVIEADGDEVPILDGSALPFLMGIRDAGLSLLPGPRRVLTVKDPIIISSGDAWAGLFPADRFTASISVNFDNPGIGAQRASFDPHKDDFVSDIAPARTFCFEDDVVRMRDSGLALGGDETNAMVFTRSGDLMSGRLRYPDEPARHKLLDALGDLHLADADIIGRFEGHRSGHRMTNELLREARRVTNLEAA